MLGDVMKRRIVLAVVVMLAAAAPAVAAFRSAAPPSRVVLGAAPAFGAKASVLGLTRVTIPPGSVIPKHRHPGTQVSTIVAGTLAYHVYRGMVQVYREVAGAPVLAFRIRAGHTGTLHAGDTLIEQPTAVHQAENHGSVPVKVVIAFLFAAGAPPSIPVK
jgi:quercetin dioxygenase-like cupin family protein